MELIYLGIVVFLFMLAVFDLLVGVSNDAVNFLNSAVGTKVARFRTILIVASIGVFIGAATSNGMMDIARHGIFQPQMFTFHELMCIFLAVMVTDVVLLDIFNTLGMPTSTTVSMVFELLGGTFILACLKILADSQDVLTFGNLLNTEKALQVILGIFLSVAIAFIVGAFVQWVARIVFTFGYTRHLKYTIGIFGGIACTSLTYFILISGLKSSSFITAADKAWIADNTMMLVGICFVIFTVLCQILHLLKVNVFKITVLLGTFSLALAFAGNDLVNFIGVPLAGYSSYLDFTANAHGLGINEFMMGSLNEEARTPVLFLFLAGAIMVYALATSKKAHNVIKTSVDLSRQEEGDEMFGSSAMARLIVRNTRSAAETISRFIPKSVGRWVDSRFQKDEIILADGAAFDLVRASVNLVLSALLIIFGTSMKLPLSTTYITFIVAMGTALADRAWSRESAVYRITGMLSVIGGWFITAFVAFIICAFITAAMYYGGTVVMVIFIAVAVVLLVQSNIRFKKKKQTEKKDDLFQQILRSKDRVKNWELLRLHAAESQAALLQCTLQEYDNATDALCHNDLRLLRKTDKMVRQHKEDLRRNRQREMVGMRRIDSGIAIENNTWFHLMSNSAQQMMYCVRRIVDPIKEHIENNFTPLSQECAEEAIAVRRQADSMMHEAFEMIRANNYANAQTLLLQIDHYKEDLSSLRKKQLDKMQKETGSVKISLLYLNWLQETQELLSSLRHLVRATEKLTD